jgi:hypothetical protein
LEVEQFIAIRREAGLHIDPATAEFDWFYAEVLDPYGVEGVPDGFSCVGREYFARAPGSDIWVSFQDLPKETQLALFPKIKPSFSG